MTAFTGIGGASQIAISDTGSNLAVFGVGQVFETGFVLQPTLRRYSKASGAGNRSRPIRITIPTSATAGTARVWLQIKPNRSSMRVVKSNQ